MTPPKWSIRFLEWFCPEDLREGILGDLQEQFEDNRHRLGLQKARLLFTWNVLRLFHPSILFRNHLNFNVMNWSMLKSHLTVAVRSMIKHKFYAVINLLGLSLSVAFIFLAYLFIRNELSYDQFHSKKDAICRVYSRQINTETQQIERQSAITAIPLGRDLAEETPGIEQFTRYASNSCIILKDNKPYREVMHFVDPAFLSMFDFPFLKGDRQTALNQPNSVLLSQEMAEKYFGKNDPLGQSLKVTLNDSNLLVVVSGVLDPQSNRSSLPFDFLMPLEQFKVVVSEESFDSYYYGFVENYVLLNKNTSPDELQALKIKADETVSKPENIKIEYGLQALSGLHTEDEIIGNALYTSPQKLYIMLAIALLVLIVAGINFITLSTSHVLNRMKEVGVRKTLGARKGQLKRQFMTESFLVTLCSGLVGMTMARFLLPVFEDITGAPISFQPGWEGIALMVSLTLSIAILTGWLKSTVLVRLSAMDALKGNMILPRRNRWFNESLVVLQFTLSIILIIGAVNIRAQMKYLQKKDLGYDEERLLELSIGEMEDTRSVVERFRNLALQDNRILSVTASMNNSREPWTELIFAQDDGNPEKIFYNQVTPEYLETMDIELLEGEDFRKEAQNASTAILVNEALVQHFGWENPFDQQIPGSNFSEGHQIIGVVKNFHFSTMHDQIRPLILTLDLESIGSGITGLSTYVWPANVYNLVVRLGPGELQPMLDQLEGVWKQVNPEQPFVFQFVDEVLEERYAEERRWGKTTDWASFLAIFIAWLGLMGMMRLSIQKRTKEVGIRKVLGASTPGLIGLLSRRFLWLIVIGNLIAWPVAWLLMGKWLESFSYRIELNPLLFILIGLVVLVISLASISVQSLRLASSNPVKTLKFE